MDVERLDHVGIRVSDEATAVAFYETLGFRVVARYPAQQVVILRSASGAELNLVVNARSGGDVHNVLMDPEVKHPGHTHVALRVRSLDDALQELAAHGITPREGPLRLGDGISAFVRDPDGNVLELREVGVLWASAFA